MFFKGKISLPDTGCGCDVENKFWAYFTENSMLFLRLTP